MAPKKKSNLSRFKKTAQGLREFAVLLEQSDPRSHEAILKDVGEEDPAFLEDALKRVVYFEELIYLDESVIAEILSAASPKILAYALRGMPETFQKRLKGQLGYRELKQVLDEEDQIKDSVKESFVLGARKQVLKIARMLESQGKFLLEAPDCPRLAGGLKKPAAG